MSHGKVTPNVRKILQSQKTFANHLSDYEAFAALALANPAASTPHPNQYTTPHPNQYTVARASPTTNATSASKDKPVIAAQHLTSTGKRSHKKKDPSQLLRKSASHSQISTPSKAAPEPVKTEPKDVVMSDAPLEPLLKPLPPNLELKTHPADNDPLLKSRIPNVPNEELLRKLVEGKPLSYTEARGQLKDGDVGAGKPGRSFCEICGYWGRVKCLRCGGKVCALECLKIHGEECYARYGA